MSELLVNLGRATPPWMLDAACRGLSPALFITERHESTSPAQQVCAVCPVKQECLDYAIAHGEQFGVWGGLGARERRRLSVRNPRPPKEINHGTIGGYVAHGRRKEPSCDACRRAHSAYKAARKAARVMDQSTQGWVVVLAGWLIACVVMAALRFVLGQYLLVASWCFSAACTMYLLHHRVSELICAMRSARRISNLLEALGMGRK